MKQTLISILLLSSALCAEAQKNNLFGDLGLPLDTGLPGVSVTYNRKLMKWFGVGVGAQGYFYARQDMYNNNVEQFTPAVFADLRGYIPIKKGQLFVMEDVGMDIYHGYNSNNTLFTHNNGIYNGLGIGYFRPINKKGISPYLSLKMVTDTYKASQTYLGETYKVTSVDATLVLSAGFKF